MIGFLLRTSVKFLMLSAMLYVTFFVRVGEHTTYEHAKRIARSEEAKQFGLELKDAVLKAKKTISGMPLGNSLALKSD